eukprot:361504-Pelagomonas_calceolata.AAC.1
MPEALGGLSGLCYPQRTGWSYTKITEAKKASNQNDWLLARWNCTGSFSRLRATLYKPIPDQDEQAPTANKEPGPEHMESCREERGQYKQEREEEK